MKIEASTREEYLAKAGEREPELREIDALIQKHAPHLKPALSEGMTGSMLGYGMQPYQNKSGTGPDEWPLIMLAAQKNYISFYACAIIDGRYIAELYQGKLGKVNCGKSCIRFKKFADVNQAGLISMLQDLDKRFAAGESLYGS